ncbi:MULTISPECIES: hypothetical protein [unclassified Bradyrhizobium]|uniref:hypothetical protein n=1 Tax=unclassified Bradyrhizobium TaxID=2631580 RepID=UPI001FF49EA7|nr:MULTISPECIES: hypothetical protein [unclassified Bradyrhizobium]MCJ9704959.1 hypothetical protein [Bradyrhizobium sp. SHOUNA76]MCJ9733106.1 hypothetical protein [Bradyrhizobium sp. PRIMUS42]
MKELAALGAGLAIAAVAALWFTTGPVVVNAEIKPLQPSANMPTFRPVPTELAGPSGRDNR